MSNFHCHSCYSTRDGIARVEEIAKFMKDHGKNYFCLTDHGTQAGHPESFEIAKKLGMKFYAGCEFYVKPGEKFDGKDNILHVAALNKKAAKLSKSKKDEDKAELLEVRKEIEEIQIPGYDESYYHITVLAYNLQGLLNLQKINNEGDFYYNVRISLDSLINHNEGLIVLSGCPAGELFKMLMYGYDDLAREYMQKMKDVFGDRFYYELMYHNIPIENAYTREYGDPEKVERDVYEKGIQLARELGIKIVATNDSHYVYPEDRKYWLITRMALLQKDESFFQGDYHMLEDNTKIAEEFKGLVTLEELDESEKEIENRLEEYDLPRSSYKSTRKEQELLERLVWTGYKKKRVDVYKKLKEAFDAGDENVSEKQVREAKEFMDRDLLQIPYELAVIQTAGFDTYFLKVREIVTTAFEEGILVGPGRGSGAGSSCTYMLDITQVDPLKFELMFERFLNPGRTLTGGLPDIDLDLSTEKCVNFDPDASYQKRFFTSELSLISDDEIRGFWRDYITMRDVKNDQRRHNIFIQATKCKEFDAPIFDVPDGYIVTTRM